MSVDEVELAAGRRREMAEDQEIDEGLRVLLAHYQTVTANPRSMGYLHSLIKHYAKSAHPWRDCYKDNLKRFGPQTSALCGVLKDTIRQSTHWRGKGPRPSDHGSPGVGISEADKPFAPPFGGHHGLKLDVPDEIWALIADVAENCDPCRVLLGLDPAPHPSTTFLSEHVEEQSG